MFGAEWVSRVSPRSSRAGIEVFTRGRFAGDRVPHAGDAVREQRGSR
ncbi:hypothetical protein [Nonomuraea sp. SBT364]|nr:hypothetical protein [Nonomuraea sp. SBT364]